MLWGHTRERARVPPQVSAAQIRNGLEPLFDGSIFKRPSAEQRNNLTSLFILAVVILSAYCNSFRTGFAQDSGGVILEDSQFTAANSQNLQKILEVNYWWPKAESGLYRRITTLSYLFNYSILGNEDSAAGYHPVNLVLHLCNRFLVFPLARLLFEDRRPALATAALWALHPICTEAVTTILAVRMNSMRSASCPQFFSISAARRFAVGAEGLWGAFMLSTSLENVAAYLMRCMTSIIRTLRDVFSRVARVSQYWIRIDSRTILRGLAGDRRGLFTSRRRSRATEVRNTYKGRGYPIVEPSLC